MKCYLESNSTSVLSNEWHRCSLVKSNSSHDWFSHTFFPPVNGHWESFLARDCQWALTESKPDKTGRVCQNRHIPFFSPSFHPYASISPINFFLLLPHCIKLNCSGAAAPVCARREQHQSHWQRNLPWICQIPLIKQRKWQNKRTWYSSLRCLPNVSCMRKNILKETQSNPSPVAIVNFLDDWKSVTCTWTFLVAQSVGIILADGKTKQVPADSSRKADSQT